VLLGVSDIVGVTVGVEVGVGVLTLLQFGHSPLFEKP
jgi:hypothetical protein